MLRRSEDKTDVARRQVRDVLRKYPCLILAGVHRGGNCEGNHTPVLWFAVICG